MIDPGLEEVDDMVGLAKVTVLAPSGEEGGLSAAEVTMGLAG